MDNSHIWLSLTHMSGGEQKYIQEAFDTNWVIPLVPNVNGFEKDLEFQLCSAAKKEERNIENIERFVVALSSGTVALHLALIQLGVQIGDEVIW